jgi:hypothetical protein
MHPKQPTFGQRTTLRQPTIIRRLPDQPEPQPLLSHAAAPLRVPTPIMQPGTSAAEPPASGSTVPATETAAPVMAMDPRPSEGAEARWARRTPSKLGGQIQHHSLAAAMPCTVRDTSSTGARLEIVSQRGGNISRDRVPDQFSLFMPLDRLEIDCQVMWRQANLIGIRYTSPARRTAKQTPIKKPEAPKKPHTSLIKLLINPL